MQLVNQHTKKIMEGCKEIALANGLSFDPSTLEYVITNREFVKLTPKVMIPTRYDFWVDDVDIIKGQKFYDVFPHNPYETVINTRPAISFYNDNNRDWMNVVIFFHVIAHIDFFQNNAYYKKTWDYDFCAKALADKRIVEKLRSKMGEEKRWVDYALEFARSIDNLGGYYSDLNQDNHDKFSDEYTFYFNVYLKKFVPELSTPQKFKKYMAGIDHYNELTQKLGPQNGEKTFFQEIATKHLDFTERLETYKKEKPAEITDLFQHLMEYSEFLNKKETRWMKEILSIVRETALYFEPQIRTKIINEGWASLWHERLFMKSPLSHGKEISYARFDSGVTALSRVGLNPYAVGKRLLLFAEELAEKGKLDYEFQKIKNAYTRKNFNQKTGKGNDFLFHMRSFFNDQSLISFLSKDDFQDFVNKYDLFVTGRKLDPHRRVWKYYIKSRKGEDYRQMLLNFLYHPPHVPFRGKHINGGNELYLNHQFEGRQLILQHIPDVMKGLAYLWGGPVRLETTVFEIDQNELMQAAIDPEYKPKFKTKRVLYKLDDYKKMPEIKEL